MRVAGNADSSPTEMKLTLEGCQRGRAGHSWAG